MTRFFSSSQFDNKASNRCHVEGCAHNYIARRHRVQLYKIPRDPLVARKWLDACGFEHLAVSPTTVTFKVCREHFTSDDFEGPTTLRPDAVPSLFTTYSRSLIEKQNFNETNSSSPKRFRQDMASIRAKQIPAVNNTMNLGNNKRAQLPYRTNQQYQRQYPHEQIQTLSPSPSREMLDENIKQLNNDNKQTLDIDLNMNCADDGLSEVQLAHCPVKVNLISLICLL